MEWLSLAIKNVYRWLYNVKLKGDNQRSSYDINNWITPDFDQLTVGGELDKLAANISIGRNWAGVHYRSDYTESIVLGEQIALGILQEQADTYKEKFACTLTRFSGQKIKFDGRRIINI